MGRSTQTKPDWDRLYETALAQEGHFTTQQALDAGYSSQLLVKYLASGKFTRVPEECVPAQAFPSRLAGGPGRPLALVRSGWGILSRDRADAPRALRCAACAGPPDA